MTEKYEVSIFKMTQFIAGRYNSILLDNADKLSLDKYNAMRADIDILLNKADKLDFYLNYDWMNPNFELAELDSKYWRVVSDFFVAAHNYLATKQNRLNTDLKEKDLEIAISRVSKKLRGQGGKMRIVNPRPIDYEKTIADTVEKAAKYYTQKLSEVPPKKLVSLVKLAVNIKVLREGKDIKNTDFYMDYRWLKPDMQLNLLDDALFQTMIKFFATVREYIDRKNKKQNMTRIEQELAMRVKDVNLKIGSTLFEPLRNMFLSPSHFLSH
jgi:hypothetical protein